MFPSTVDGSEDEAVGIVLSPPRPAARLVLWILLEAAGLNGLAIVRGNDNPDTAERCHGDDGDGDNDKEQQHQKKAANTFADFVIVRTVIRLVVSFAVLTDSENTLLLLLLWFMSTGEVW